MNVSNTVRYTAFARGHVCPLRALGNNSQRSALVI